MFEYPGSDGVDHCVLNGQPAKSMHITLQHHDFNERSVSLE